MEIIDKNLENQKIRQDNFRFFIFLTIFLIFCFFVWFMGWSDDSHFPWLQYVFGIPCLMLLGISGYFFLYEISNETRLKETTFLVVLGLMSGVLVFLFNFGVVVGFVFFLISFFIVGAIAYSWFSETTKNMKGLIKYLQFILTFGFSYAIFYVTLLFFTWLSVEWFHFGNSFLQTLTGVPINVAALILFWGIAIGFLVMVASAWHWTNELVKPIVKKWLSIRYDQISKKTGTASFTIPRRYVFIDVFVSKIAALFAVILVILMFSLLIHLVERIPRVGWRIEKMIDSHSSNDDYVGYE